METRAEIYLYLTVDKRLLSNRSFYLMSSMPSLTAMSKEASQTIEKEYAAEIRQTQINKIFLLAPLAGNDQKGTRPLKSSSLVTRLEANTTLRKVTIWTFSFATPCCRSLFLHAGDMPSLLGKRCNGTYLHSSTSICCNRTRIRTALSSPLAADPVTMQS